MAGLGGCAGRSSTTCGTLADLDPARDRGHAGGRKDEQHVPARRGVVAVRVARSRSARFDAVGRVGEVNITLVKVVGVRHRARPDQRHPPDAGEVGGRDRELLVVAYRRRRAGDRRPRPREQVRRGEDLAGVLQRTACSARPRAPARPAAARRWSDTSAGRPAPPSASTSLRTGSYNSGVRTGPVNWPDAPPPTTSTVPSASRTALAQQPGKESSRRWSSTPAGWPTGPRSPPY